MAFAVASLSLGQPAPLRQVDVLFGGEPSPTGFSFGEAVSASGSWVAASGVAVDGAQLLRAWERDEGGVWQVGYDELAAPGAATAGSPVAIAGGRLFRASDNLFFGFLIEDRFLAGAASEPWEFTWNPLDATARAVSLDAWGLTQGDFAAGSLVAVGYQTTLTSPAFLVAEYALLVRDSQQGHQLVYADSVVFGGEPSVSADNYQAAVGLPGAAQVVVVTSGPEQPWVEQQAINGPTGVGFGTSVAIRGNRLAIGAPQGVVCIIPPSTGCTTTGQVYLYARSGGVWTLDRVLITAFDQVPDGAQVGASLDFSRVTASRPLRRLAIGAPGWSSAQRGGQSPDGSILLAAENAFGDWRLQARATTSPADTNGLGTAVAFSGDGDLLAGAPAHNEGARVVGAALVYRETIFEANFNQGHLQEWSVSVP